MTNSINSQGLLPWQVEAETGPRTREIIPPRERNFQVTSGDDVIRYHLRKVKGTSNSFFEALIDSNFNFSKVVANFSELSRAGKVESLRQKFISYMVNASETGIDEINKLFELNIQLYSTHGTRATKPSESFVEIPIYHTGVNQYAGLVRLLPSLSTINV